MCTSSAAALRFEVKGVPAPWKERWTLPGATLRCRGSALLGEVSLRDLEDRKGHHVKFVRHFLEDSFTNLF